jgi:FolB domain-containing protein
MDKIFIQNLKVQGVLGINPEERISPRTIIINIVIQTDTSAAAKTDSIENSVDYSSVVKDIKSLVKKAKRFTVEALAEDIASFCLQHPRVRKVTVKVEKPLAVNEADSVGVEIERSS